LDDELFFRVVFTILWVAFIVNLTWIRHNARVPRSGAPDGQKERQEMQLHTIVLAIFGPLWFGGIILYIFLPSSIAFLAIPIPDWFRMIMACVTALSIPFIIWAYRTIGKNWVHALDPSKFLNSEKGVLVTGGPYRCVRNPIYGGSFVFIIAMSLLASNLLLLLPSLFLITVIYMQIPKEESMLIDRFGDEYREYMKRTPRIIPRLIRGRAMAKKTA
jgi:protein-S-isoprenylcysteine O-methyltransferase Ste14